MRLLSCQLLVWGGLLAALSGGALAAYGQDNDPKSAPSKESATEQTKWHITMRTLGGKQFWTDHLVHGQWRIQQNIVTGHYRLLDADNGNRVSGTWDQCFERWQKLRESESVPALKPHVVVLLHGLIRSRSSMAGMARYLEEKTDFETISFSYASTRAPVQAQAAALADVVRRLDGVRQIDFVAHSLGNLVIRHFLKDQMDAAADHQIDTRIGRIVMLAPPNQGAQLAKRQKDNLAFKILFGAGGRQLAEQWHELEPQLAVPPCEFGIIAAESKSWIGTNPLLSGKDDYVVRVQETRLDGARDFLVVPGLHTLIMDQDRVREATVRFLQHGYFISAAQRHPLPDRDAAPHAVEAKRDD